MASARKSPAPRRPAPSPPSPWPEGETAARAWTRRLGHRFRNPELLNEALTHRSFASLPGAGKKTSDNERLEFLGDAVLGLRASERLLQAFPQAAEGQLSRLRSWLVSARRLAIAARALDLGPHLRLSPAEERVGGREKDRLLANAMEALIGAVHSDGGYPAAARFIDHHLLEDLASLSLDHVHEFAYKSLLQEWAHAHGHAPPHYQVVAAGGPEHQKSFIVAVRLNGLYEGHAGGSSIKKAEQAAARGALQAIQAMPEAPSL